MNSNRSKSTTGLVVVQFSTCVLVAHKLEFHLLGTSAHVGLKDGTGRGPLGECSLDARGQVPSRPLRKRAWRVERGFYLSNVRSVLDGLHFGAGWVRHLG